MDRIVKILKFAMRMEEDAQKFYEYYSGNVSSDKTAQLFQRLADIEKDHYKILKEKYDYLEVNEPPMDISWVVDATSAEKNPSILADNSEVTSSGKNSSSDLNVLRMAFLIENDFAEFYGNAVGYTDNPDIKSFFITLKDWETGHREMFYQKYRELLLEHWGELSGIIFK